MIENDGIIYYQIVSSMIEHFHPGLTLIRKFGKYPQEKMHRNQSKLVLVNAP
jgi:hypothetical protein